MILVEFNLCLCSLSISNELVKSFGGDFDFQIGLILIKISYTKIGIWPNFFLYTHYGNNTNIEFAWCYFSLMNSRRLARLLIDMLHFEH